MIFSITKQSLICICIITFQYIKLLVYADFFMNLYIYLLINVSGCGYSVVNSAAAAGRIVGGQEVNPRHKLPYQMFLQVTAAASYLR